MAHNQMEVLKMNKAIMEIEVYKDKTIMETIKHLFLKKAAVNLEEGLEMEGRMILEPNHLVMEVETKIIDLTEDHIIIAQEEIANQSIDLDIKIHQENQNLLIMIVQNHQVEDRNLQILVVQDLKVEDHLEILIVQELMVEDQFLIILTEEELELLINQDHKVH